MRTPPLPPLPPGQRVRSISLEVTHLPDGGYRLSTPLARGWAAVARDQVQLSQVMARAFLEVSCASYARLKGQVYDLDAMTTHVPGDPLADLPQRRARAGRRTVRRRTYDPQEWSRMEDGRWRSPSGRAYRPDSRVVQGVLAKLEHQQD